VQESEHIFINYGFNFCKADPVRIFEVGFGTGLNVLLTCAKSLNGSRKVIYTSVDKFPVDDYIVHQLNHQEFAGEKGMMMADLIYSQPWGEMKNIIRNFSLLKLKADMISDDFKGEYDLIYFDAFGPDKQPEMWSMEIFRKISGITVQGGILVTYSAKGQVKRNLKASGFNVELLPGPPGKRQVIRAVKI
jgi:tRNA U34 5-methylaminomethyl-2-thiouridine-forming methyltransferase MnmC